MKYLRMRSGMIQGSIRRASGVFHTRLQAGISCGSAAFHTAGTAVIHPLRQQWISLRPGRADYRNEAEQEASARHRVSRPAGA